jgi:pyruvate, water dikinase
MNLRLVLSAGVMLAHAGCGPSDLQSDAGSEIREGTCEVAVDDQAPDAVQRIGCRADFDVLASEPLDTSIPGARSVKVVFDQLALSGEGELYFQNSVKYAIHYDFVSAHLSGDGLPIVSTLNEFNQVEYYSPERRFILGAVTHYEGPDAWTLEIAPYDKATPDMIATLYRAVHDAAYFGIALVFHPTSETIDAELSELPDDVATISTETLYEGIDYQPLNLATGVGRLRSVNAAELATIYLSPSDLVVLDAVPNDITVVAGLITAEFQTPLSHVNVLAQNRKTPNMGLRNAHENEELRALEGEWVRLIVGAFDWRIEAISGEEAEEFLSTHGPEPVVLPAIDMTVRDLRDIEDVVVQGEDQSLRDAIVAALPAFGGKAAHFSVMAREDSIPLPKAFAVPAYYYVQMMEENGFTERVRQWLDEPEFRDDPSVRDARLAELRDAIMLAPVSEELQQLLRDKLEEYPEERIRFRTSTNSEDLEGFPCAGCYESHTGDRSDWNDVLDAIRETWGSIWLFRTFEERSWYKVDHPSVTMALLVHHSYPDEEANGVALTANPFDPSGLEPAFYVNVQFGGDYEVVHPSAGVTSDEIIYNYYTSGQPITYISRSNVLPEGQDAVLTPSQLYELGTALDTIHELFSDAYGPDAGNEGWYAMDVEFKLDGPTPETGSIEIKQARPHPGRGE